jgi:putative hydrolase of the HAD superfamily
MYKSIIFDLDDTLIHCGRYYLECKARFTEFQHSRTGLSVDIISKLLADLDVTCTGLPDGFSKERFPRSFAAVSTILDIIRGEQIDSQSAEESYLIGASVFDAPYEPISGAFETLTTLGVDLKLFLNTKGDFTIQQRKIDKHNLHRFFPPGHVYIVPKKDKWGIFKILQDHNLNANETLVVGDSIRDDIGSAVEMGVDSVLVTKDHDAWAYENCDHMPTFKLGSVSELIGLINSPNAE